MKHNKIFLAAATALLSVAYSCTDQWNEHFDVHTTGKGTIWQQLSADESLSNFKQVVWACGYDVTLDGSQTFSVFAPTNDVLTDQKRDSVIALYRDQKAEGIKDTKNKAVVEFIQNYIALYNTTVVESDTKTAKPLSMLNGKRLHLTSSDFNGAKLETVNQVFDNGVLYKISGLSPYKSNIYEYIRNHAEFDSIATFFNKYHLEKFNSAKSVPGEYNDEGLMVYRDSVFNIENEVTRDWLRGSISDEDSTYTMLVPTNELWKEKLKEYQKFYKYDPEVKTRDSLAYFFPRWNIVSGSVFSNNINTDKVLQDTAFSTNAVLYNDRFPTYKLYEKNGDDNSFIEYKYDKKYYQYEKPLAEGGVLSKGIDISCSNGTIKKVTEWPFDDTKKFLRDIVIEAESSIAVDSVDEQSTQAPIILTATTSEAAFYDKISGHSFIGIYPTSIGNTKTYFSLDNTLSGIDYDVYVVMVPNSIFTGADIPAAIRATVSYYDSKVQKTQRVEFATSQVKVSDPTTVDSVYIGTYNFPTATYGVAESNQKVKLVLETRVLPEEVTAGTRVLPIYVDCIVLRPRKK